jgi:molecular chaperone GrpE
MRGGVETRGVRDLGEMTRFPDSESSEPVGSVRDGDEAAESQPEGGALADAIRERDEYLDQLQRSRAEFANYQKRMRAQAEGERAYAVGNLARDILAVLDNLERALEAARSSGDEAMIGGLELVYKQLLDTLAKHGVEPIEALHAPFDPNYHEAVAQRPDGEHPEGTVVNEFSRGYRIHDRVLRPSKVAVSTGDAQAARSSD